MGVDRLAALARRLHTSAMRTMREGNGISICGGRSITLDQTLCNNAQLLRRTPSTTTASSARVRGRLPSPPVQHHDTSSEAPSKSFKPWKLGRAGCRLAEAGSQGQIPDTAAELEARHRSSVADKHETR